MMGLQTHKHRSRIATLNVEGQCGYQLNRKSSTVHCLVFLLYDVVDVCVFPVRTLLRKQKKNTEHRWSWLCKCVRVAKVEERKKRFGEDRKPRREEAMSTCKTIVQRTSPWTWRRLCPLELFTKVELYLFLHFPGSVASSFATFLSKCMCFCHVTWGRLHRYL